MSNVFIGFLVNREGQIKSPLHNVCPSIPRNRIYSHMLLHCCTVSSVGPINSSLKNTYLKKNECPTYGRMRNFQLVESTHFVGSMPTCVDRFHPFFITDEHFL